MSRPCVLVTKTARGANHSVGAAGKSETISSRLGGLPLLDPEQTVPVDKAGRPMLFLAQIDFAELPVPGILGLPREGMLSWFVNQHSSFENPKDRNAFKVLWQEGAIDALTERDVQSPFSSPLALGLAEGTNQPSSHHLLGELLTSINYREICAFAANGISWSPARSADSCYEHLVAASAAWRLLWYLPSSESEGTLPDLALFITEDDLATRNLHRSWMLKV